MLPLCAANICCRYMLLIYAAHICCLYMYMLPIYAAFIIFSPLQFLYVNVCHYTVTVQYSTNQSLYISNFKIVQYHDFYTCLRGFFGTLMQITITENTAHCYNEQMLVFDTQAHGECLEHNIVYKNYLHKRTLSIIIFYNLFCLHKVSSVTIRI